MDVSQLTDEERQTVLDLAAQIQGGSPQSSDSAQDASQMEPLMQAVDVLIDKLEQVCADVDDLKDKVDNQLFGGIKRLYDSNLREQSIGKIKSQYGEMFDPHMDAIGSMYPGEDVYASLHDLVDQARQGNPDWSDEDTDGAIKGAHARLMDIIGKVKGPEAPVAVEVTKTETTPVEDDGVEPGLIDKVARMRDAARKKGIKY